MEWYDRGIGPAIQEAKARNTLFVVAIVAGPEDETSKKFLGVLSEASGKLVGTVAIKLIHGSDTFKQFIQLYPVILVPSIYFIDSKSGVDLEVTGGPAMTADSLSKSIEKAFSAKNGAASASPAPSDPIPVPQKESGDKNQESSKKASLDERVAKAKKLLQEKRDHKVQDEDDKEKNSELERRALGKNIQEMKRKHEEEEAQRIAEQRKKDKEEERLAKERVKAQIAQDRADKASKFNQLKNEEEQKRQELKRQRMEEEAAVRERQAASRSTVAKIQFRLPDGRAQTNNFDAGAPLSAVYQYVAEDVPTGFGRSFSLSMAFPRKHLDSEPRTSTLHEVGLAPSATLMVTPTSQITTHTGSIMDYVWLLLTPFTIIWTFIQSVITTNVPGTANASGNDRKRQGDYQPSTSQSASKKRAYTRDGNIARLRNGDDDDDETNTYNGNSTQQM